MLSQLDLSSQFKKKKEYELRNGSLGKSLRDSNWPYTHNIHAQASTDWPLEGENANNQKGKLDLENTLN